MTVEQNVLYFLPVSPLFSCPSHPTSTGIHHFPLLSSSLHPSNPRSTARWRAGTSDAAVTQQDTHRKTPGKEREVNAGHG